MRGINPDIYRNRPNSCLVASTIVNYGVSKQQYAEALGVSPHYLDNKLTRGSFSIRDVYILAYIAFKGEDKSITESYLELTGDLDRLKTLEKKWKKCKEVKSK